MEARQAAETQETARFLGNLDGQQRLALRADVGALGDVAQAIEIDVRAAIQRDQRPLAAFFAGDISLDASHGECWSFALALRLASFELLRDEGIEPVLVLDDVFAELDVGRRERLAGMVATARQVLVTCAVEADVPSSLRGARFQVSEGEVRRVED